MVNTKKREQGSTGYVDGNASLAALSRTLERLESRLAGRTTSEKEDLPPVQPSPKPEAASIPMRESDAAPASRREGTGKPALADAVSQIVMRRQMLERGSMERKTQSEPHAEGARPADAAIDRRFHELAQEIQSLQAQGANYSLIAGVAEELQALREELNADISRHIEPRFDDMRSAFDDLRRMIGEREDARMIDAEIARVDDGLSRMAHEGADQGTIQALRGELGEMRSLVGEMAREETVHSVGRAFGAFELRQENKADAEAQEKRDLRGELERLRDSLRTLASQDQVMAVERRWADFETRYMQNTPPTEDAISGLLKIEMNGLREKLETLASERSIKAVEERWGALEQRFASREIETRIEEMAERMAQLETSLAKLPETLPIAPLEQRIHALAVGIDAIARQQQEPDLDHFLVLEDRLDEISRAIVSNANRTPPAMDMAPIERIESRIADLTNRVDFLADDGEAAELSEKIAELSARIETLANDDLVIDLAARMESFSQKLETAFGEHEAPQLDTTAIEERLAALTARLEEAAAPRVDDELVRSLEAQIANLAEFIGRADFNAVSSPDPEVERRLEAMEQRLDRNRDDVIAAARAAADEAVKAMVEAGERRDSEHVARLSDDLRALEALSRETDERSTGVFEAVHATLLKIVDRLDEIENDIHATAHAGASGSYADERDARAIERVSDEIAASGAAEDENGLRGKIARRLRHANAAPSDDGWSDPDVLDREAASAIEARPRHPLAAPSLDAADVLDAREANRPLEIGSGTPDIAALLERVRAQQAGTDGESDNAGRADFIAAARRAAMAAASEAELLRPSAGGGADNKRSLAEIASRRRKPILMAVGAVLLALMAIPLGRTFLAANMFSDGDADALQIEVAAVPEEAIAAPAPVEAVAAAAEAPETAVVPEPGESTAVDVASVVPSTPEMPEPVPTEASAVEPAAPAENAAAGLLAPAASPSSDMAAALKPGAGEASAEPAASGQDAALPATTAADGPIPTPPAGIGPAPLLSAAESGDAKALFEIGLRLMEGRKGEPNPQDAVAWFERSAARGFAPAQYSLGTLFEKGNGVERDTIKARDWYRMAAEQGNVRAMHNLAVLYATGVDGKSEPETAADWFKTAADHGMRDSQYNLGILFARGAGVDQDLTESYKWFSVVAKSGDKDAADKKTEVAKSLDPAQLADAEKKAADWAPRPRVETANTVDIPETWNDDPEHTASVDMKRAVRNIQAILIQLGYQPGEPDGLIGGKTVNAIREFQREAGLKADGQINETLIRALLERKDS